MKEREVSVFNLLLDMLAGWRLAIVLLLLFGLGFGGMSYVKSIHPVQAQKESFEKIKQENAGAEENVLNEKFVREQLKEEEIIAVEKVIADEKVMASYMEYRDESVYMKIDPFDVKQEKMTFYVTSDDIMKSYSIEKMYESIVKSGEMLEYVSDKCDMSSQIANELIILSASQSMLGTDTFSIYVLNKDEKTCAVMADAVIDYFQNEEKKLMQIAGEHELKLLKRSNLSVMDTSILDAQKRMDDIILQYENNAEASVKSFSSNQKKLYSILKGEDEELDELVPQVSVKSIFVGIIGAVVIYAFIIFVKFIANNKLRKDDNFSYMFSIPELGRVMLEKKHRLFGFVDSRIDAIRTRNRRRFSLQESIKLAATAIENIIKSLDINEICLVGCDLTNGTNDVCEKLLALLQKEKINVKVLNNLIYDADNMSILSEKTAVVLVETTNKVLYSEIVKEIDILKQVKAKVLGAVIVEE